MKRIIILIAAAVLLASCGPTTKITRSSQYPGMYREKPLTLLVMPPINKTTNVEAKDLLYTSILHPLAEAGYYVIPPRLVLDILKQESAYDSELFIDKPLTKFKDFFGADAVIFCEITRWVKSNFSIQTDLRYIVKMAASGEIVFDRSCKLYLDLNSTSTFGGSSIFQLTALITSAIETAATDHIKAARSTNYYIFKDLPRGKYDPDYGLDGDVAADKKDISITVK